MSAGRNLAELLAVLDPVVEPDQFVFVSQAGSTVLPALATVHEAEGVTYVLRRFDADERGLTYQFTAAWITLRVHSALDEVGLIAAVSTTLADAGISCNVLAGYFHDHLLVPYDRAEEAVQLLRALSEQHR